MTYLAIITDRHISEGDISPIKHIYDELISFPENMDKHEGVLSIRLEGKSFPDAIDALVKPEFRAWFKNVDEECPGLPYFLEGNNSQTSLFIFFAALIPFKKENGKLIFDSAAQHILEEKYRSVRRLCLKSNIGPQRTLNRMHTVLFGAPPIVNDIEKSSDKIAAKKRPLSAWLDEYGSVAYIAKDRIKIAVIMDSHREPETIGSVVWYDTTDHSVIRISFTGTQQPAYADAIVLQNDAFEQALNNGYPIDLIGVISAEMKYHRIFTQPWTTIEHKKEPLPRNDQPDDTGAERSDTSADDDLNLCRKENEQLKEKIRSLEALVAEQEETINAPKKKGFFSSLFRKFFP